MKKREKYEKAKKRWKSKVQDYKGGKQARYGGEMGIKTNVFKSTPL